MLDGVVHILDDSESFRRSTAWWLEGLGCTVREHAEPEPALAELARAPGERPCCLLLDVRMPAMSGLDVHDWLAAHGVRMPVIYMTGHGDVPLAVAAMRKGALTFLEKPLDEAALLAAIEAAFANPAATAARDGAPLRADGATPDATGESDVGAPERHGAAVADAAPLDRDAVLREAARSAGLTSRETQVFELLLARDASSREIGELLGVAMKTVEAHRSKVLRKFNVRSTGQLVREVLSDVRHGREERP